MAWLKSAPHKRALLFAVVILLGVGVLFIVVRNVAQLVHAYDQTTP